MKLTQKPSGLVVPAEPPKPPKPTKLWLWDGSSQNLPRCLEAIENTTARLISVVNDQSAFQLGGRYIVTYEHDEQVGFEELC